MPVLPLVGSSRMVSGLILPSRCAASIIATPIRSFTEPAGFWLSSLATTVALAPSMMRLSRTSGVFPISLVTSSAMRIRAPSPARRRARCLSVITDVSNIAGAVCCQAESLRSRRHAPARDLGRGPSMAGMAELLAAIALNIWRLGDGEGQTLAWKMSMRHLGRVRAQRGRVEE